MLTGEPSTMHREITPSERLGHAETPLSLYLLTALLGLLLGATVDA